MVEGLKPRWKELTGGKLLIATRGVYSEFTLDCLRWLCLNSEVAAQKVYGW